MANRELFRTAARAFSVIARTAPRRASKARVKTHHGSRTVVAAYVGLALAALGLVFVGGWARRPEWALACHVAAGFAWIVAWRAAERTSPSPAFVLGGALLLRCLALSSHLDTSDDVHRYVWEGELVRRGISPYAAAPADPSLESMRAEFPGLAASVGHPEIPAIYPPLVQGVGAVTATWVDLTGGSLERDGPRILRFLFAAADLAVLLPLSYLLRARRRPVGALVAWAWCPLVAFEFAGASHFDSLGILLLVAGIAAWDRLDADVGREAPSPNHDHLALGGFASRRGGEVRAALLVAGAVLVKYLPLLVLAWAGRRGASPPVEHGTETRAPTPPRRASSGEAGASRFGWGRVALVAVLVGLAFVPFAFLVGAERGFAQAFVSYGTRWEAGSLVFRFVRGACESWPIATWWWIHPYELPRFLTALAGLVAVAWIVRREDERARGVGRCVAVFLLLTPTLHPWYLTWLVPFLALRPSAAWIWLVATAGVLYAPLAAWQLERAWIEPAWMWPAFALPFFVLAIAPFNWVRRLRKLCGEP